MAVAEWTGTLLDWRGELAALKRFISPALGRAETRETAGLFIDGLLSSAERKTGWMLAEATGLEGPYRFQSLLGRSSWSADHLRDLVRAYVAEALGDEGGVLVIDGEPIRRTGS
jgi:SRSO17 transposase